MASKSRKIKDDRIPLIEARTATGNGEYVVETSGASSAPQIAKECETEASKGQSLAVYETATGNELTRNPTDFAQLLQDDEAKQKLLDDYIRRNLKDGTDYGSIPTKRGPSKPSLWKSGAEKICRLLRLTPVYSADEELIRVLGKRAEGHLILKCVLFSNGKPVAEGRGARSIEKDFGDINKSLKMAEKSAMIDATLRIVAMSGQFSQDLEDMPASHFDSDPTPAPLPVDRNPKPLPKPKIEPTPIVDEDGDAADIKCRKCGGPMWDNRIKRAEAEKQIDDGVREKKAPPAFRCRDEKCGGIYWSADEAFRAANKILNGEVKAQSTKATLEKGIWVQVRKAVDALGISDDEVRPLYLAICGGKKDEPMARLKLLHILKNGGGKLDDGREVVINKGKVQFFGTAVEAVDPPDDEIEAQRKTETDSDEIKF